MVSAVLTQLGGRGIHILDLAAGAAGNGQARAVMAVDRPFNQSRLGTLRAKRGVLSLAQV